MEERKRRTWEGHRRLLGFGMSRSTQSRCAMLLSHDLCEVLVFAVQAVASTYGVTIKKIHTHIGSGSDPAVWKRAAGD